MTTTRLLLPDLYHPSTCHLPSSSTLKCCLKLRSDGHKERKSPASVSNSKSVITKEENINRRLLDSSFLPVQVTAFVLRKVIEKKSWKLQIQDNIEKVIFNSRFFTIFAVAGTLLGSMLCFFEGCCLVLECYKHNLNGLWDGAKTETSLHLLIQALDMFLFGTSMVVLGLGIYNMFVGKNRQNEFLSMESIDEAKRRIGYAVVMILHVGMVEKFKTTPLLTCIDLAAFAASLFISSASIFLLSFSF